MRRTVSYAAMTKDEAQRSIRTFYEAVKIAVRRTFRRYIRIRRRFPSGLQMRPADMLWGKWFRYFLIFYTKNLTVPKICVDISYVDYGYRKIPIIDLPNQEKLKIGR